MVKVQERDRIAAAELIETYWPDDTLDHRQMRNLATSYRLGYEKGIWAQAFAKHGRQEFNRGILIAASTLINCWGHSTEAEELLGLIGATPEMIESMDFTDYDKIPILEALESKEV